MAMAPDDSKDRTHAVLYFALIFAVLAVVIAAAAHVSGVTSFPVMVVGGAVVMIVTLAAIALVFALAGLNDNRYAFGLPDGSIRAILAVGLFAAFVGTAGYLYTGLAKSELLPVGTNVHGTDADMLNYKKQFVVVEHKTEGNPDIKADLYSRLDPSQAAADLAKQIFTTVATALVTVIGFYFGSGSLSAAVNAVRSVNAPNAPVTDAERASSIETGAQRVGANSDTAAAAVAAACSHALQGQAALAATADETSKAMVTELEAAAKKAPELLATIKQSLAEIAKQLILVRNADTPNAARQEALKAADVGLAAARSGFDQLSELRDKVDETTRNLANALAPPLPNAPPTGDADAKKPGDDAGPAVPATPTEAASPVRQGPDLSKPAPGAG